MRSLDGHPLQVKQLKGEEPVEVINLSMCNLSSEGLTELSAVVIASLISSNTATKSLKCAPRPLMTDLINAKCQ